jgi:hypothetical protein
MCCRCNVCPSPQVLVVPGIFIATDFASEDTISQGGPLGDLIQWADLIAALHVLGHNVTLHWDVYQAVRGSVFFTENPCTLIIFYVSSYCRLRYDKYLWADAAGCPKKGMDLIFTDILALRTFPTDVMKKHR